MTSDHTGFRLYPRKPRQLVRDESKAWSIAFKRIMHYARMSRKKRGGASRNTPNKPRKRFNQRCAVRVIYSRNKTAGQWFAHGRYLMRESARGRSSAPTAFTAENELADLSATLAAWQKAGDERLFKLILSPEFGDRMDLQRLTRELMRQMEKDLHTRLKWAAVTHFNTQHPHVHIVLRGIRDTGASLQAVVPGRRQPIRQDREGLAARVTDSPPHPDACVSVVVALTESPAVADDRVVTANGTSPRQQAQRDHPGSMLSFASGSAINSITAGVKARR